MDRLSVVSRVGHGCKFSGTNPNDEITLTKTPIIAVQTAVSLRDVPVATGLTLFFQQLGGSIFLAIGQAVLVNKLLPQMQQIDPSITANQIVRAGATGLESLVSPEQLPQVVSAYARAIDATFIAPIVTSALAFVATFGIEWKSVKEMPSEDTGEKIDFT